jgi:hypothetical protein
MKGLGKGMSEFKKASKGEDESNDKSDPERIEK